MILLPGWLKESAVDWCSNSRSVIILYPNQTVKIYYISNDVLSHHNDSVESEETQLNLNSSHNNTSNEVDCEVKLSPPKISDNYQYRVSQEKLEEISDFVNTVCERVKPINDSDLTFPSDIIKKTAEYNVISDGAVCDKSRYISTAANNFDCVNFKATGASDNLPHDHVKSRDQSITENTENVSSYVISEKVSDFAINGQNTPVSHHSSDNSFVTQEDFAEVKSDAITPHKATHNDVVAPSNDVIATYNDFIETTENPISAHSHSIHTDIDDSSIPYDASKNTDISTHENFTSRHNNLEKTAARLVNNDPFHFFLEFLSFGYSIM